MRVLIPSYGRCGKVTTLPYALRLTDKVTISTQTEADRDAYQREYGDVAEVIYRPCENAAGNRNTLLMTMSESDRAIMLDDDCPQLMICEGERWRNVRTATADDIETMLDKMQSVGCSVGGPYPVSNPMFAFKQSPAVLNRMTIGAAMLFVGNRVRFNESYDLCEDYELCLRTVAGGENIVRFNRLICKDSGDTMKECLGGRTSGGMADRYAAGAHAKAMRRLLAEYAPMAKASRDGTSMAIDARYV